jgi:PAS domain S-box-containing protein
MNKLKSSSAELRLLAAVEFSPNGLLMSDREGKIVLVNKEAERLFGYRREELLGISIEILVPQRFRARHSGYRAEFYEHPSARAMGAGRDLYGSRKDGTEFPVEIGLSPVQTDEGLYVLSSVVDITARKKTEEALQKALEDLKRSNQELEQFAYIASHDLQEPLRMVIGFLNLLDERYGPQLDDTATRYINFAVDGARRMSQLISDLLDYSRVEHMGPNIQRVDLNRVLASATANLRDSIQESSARIIHDQLPTVPGNATHLTQLFQNLLGNAIKFRREGIPPQIDVGCRRDGDYWLLMVKDNGIGIAPEYRNKIFMIFQRLHSREKYPGTGIGLAICKKIVERHGGNIWIDSNPGEGSTFYFTLAERTAPRTQASGSHLD